MSGLTLKKVDFEFRHENCLVQETTERHPGVKLTVLASYMVEGEVHLDLLARTPGEATVDLLEDLWLEHHQVGDVVRMWEGARNTRFHLSYSWDDSVYPLMLEHKPVSFRLQVDKGTEYYDVVGEGSKINDMLGAFEERGHVELRSSRTVGRDLDLGPMWPQEEPDLTGRQMESLLFAVSQGYYGWPRGVSASDLARHMGVSPSTLLEHLREAESRVLGKYLEDEPGEGPG